MKTTYTGCLFEQPVLNMLRQFANYTILIIFAPCLILADSTVRVCCFWNRCPEPILISPIDSPVNINGIERPVGDTIIFHSGESFQAYSANYFAITGGNASKMVYGKCFGKAGGDIFADIPIDKWVLLALLGEFPKSTPLEALCAGAIVLRSFALSGRHHDNCDVCDRTHCALLPTPQIIADKYRHAIQKTSGIVLTCENEIIAGTITSNCGGNTISAESLWGTKGKCSIGVIDSFCKPYRWEFSVEKAKIEKVFDAPPNEWRLVHDSTGTILETFVGYKMSGFKFWCILVDVLGWGTLRSPAFSIECGDDSIRFNGVGFGHRVGLCQDGAVEMAIRGASFERILRYYFPRARISEYSGE